MTKVISFGKFAVSGKNPANEIVVELNYKKNAAGQPCFSAMGTVYTANHRDCVMGGQCLEALKAYLHSNELFMQIYGLWKRNHLNDVDACADDQQREAVQEYMESHGNRYDYDAVCKFLQDRGIYTVYINGVPCTYGMQWYYRPISREDQKTIRKIMEAA